MAIDSEHPADSLAGDFGALIGLVSHEVEAVAERIGTLGTGYTPIYVVNHLRNGPWLYLVGGGIFVAVAVGCRGFGRA